MRRLESLAIRGDGAVGERLRWYYQVSCNMRPAKYLICRRIPCEVDLKAASEEELWLEHDRLTEAFLHVWRDIRSGGPMDTGRAKVSFLDLKVELVKRMLTHCNFCRWNCRVDRSKGTKHGACQLESVSRVSSYFHHRGEELPIRGAMGSGTIFFTSCNMRCCFCQNGDISKDKDNGMPITPELLALMAWQLRMEGCHNINLVGGEPTIHLHTIVEAISSLDFKRPRAEDLERIMQAYPDASYRWDAEGAYYQGELNVPILWNSNFFMSLEAMKILRTLIDVWLPDFKFGNDKCALHLSRTPWYFETVARNHKLVYEWGEDMIVRHLIMPNHVECCTKPVLGWIAANMPGALVNVMDQYHPDCFADPCSPQYKPLYADVSGFPKKEEILAAYRYAKELGIPFEAVSNEKSVYGLKA